MAWVHPRDRKITRKPDPLFKNKHWEQCFQDFIAQLRSNNPVSTTAYQYGCWLRRFFTDPSIPPDRYTRSDVERFIAAITTHRKDAGKTPSAYTRNVRLSALRAFYSYASDYSISIGKEKKSRPIMSPARDPTRKIKDAKTSIIPRAMSDDELSRFFAAINDEPDTVKRARDRAIFLALLWSGRRRSAIVSLHWRDIQIISYVVNGVQREMWIYQFREKGHLTIDDSAEMPADAVNAIKAYLEVSGRWGTIQPHEPLFPGQWEIAPLSLNYVNGIFNQYAEKAGIVQRGLHRFRWTRARATYELHHDLEAVQKLLRHESIQTTARYVKTGTVVADADAIALHGRFGHL